MLSGAATKVLCGTGDCRLIQRVGANAGWMLKSRKVVVRDRSASSHGEVSRLAKHSGKVGKMAAGGLSNFYPS